MFEVAERLRNVKVSASAAMTRKVRELRAQGVKIVGLSPASPTSPRRCTPSRPPTRRPWPATPSIRRRTA